jgi:acyl-CoA thioester hydrolase
VPITRLPEAEDLSSLRVLLERETPPSYGDANGHVNVRHYLALHDDAGWPFFESLGLDADYIDRERASFFDAEHHLRYVGEVLVGDRVRIYGRAIGRTNKAFHGQWYLFDVTRGYVANIFEFVTVHVDLDTRRAEAMPAHIAESIDDHLDHDRQLPWAAPLSGALGLRR